MTRKPVKDLAASIRQRLQVMLPKLVRRDFASNGHHNPCTLFAKRSAAILE